MRFGGAETNARAHIEASHVELTPRRTRLTAQGDNPAADAKLRVRAQRVQEQREKEERYLQRLHVGMETTARQLEREAERLEALLDTGMAGTRLPKIT